MELNEENKILEFYKKHPQAEIEIEVKFLNGEEIISSKGKITVILHKMLQSFHQINVNHLLIDELFMNVINKGLNETPEKESNKTPEKEGEEKVIKTRKPRKTKIKDE